jgi:hypothetical protein
MSCDFFTYKYTRISSFWKNEISNVLAWSIGKRVFLAQVELIVRAKIRYFTHTNTSYDWLFREST